MSSNLTNNNNISLPVLPPSLRSTFTALPGGVRGVVRKYFHHVYALLWPYRPFLHPSLAPPSFIFLIPGVLTSLELNIQDVAVLGAVNFLSGGGKRGILMPELEEVTQIKAKRLQSIVKGLCDAGYISRSRRCPSHPYQYVKTRPAYMLLTPEGVSKLWNLSKLFRSSFYGVVNRAAFGTEHGNTKNPAQINEPG